MKIHHTQLKKAERLGFILTEAKNGMIVAHWPKYNEIAYGVSPTEAITQMEALQKIVELDDTITSEVDAENPRLQFFMKDGSILGGRSMTPHQAYEELTGDAMPLWYKKADAASTPPDEEPRNSDGIPLNGAVAYREGVLAADCPFDPESDDEEERNRAEKWYTEWDEAADAEPEPAGGSVVASRYRIKYAELGHPTHCGDWLATLLNNLCLTSQGIDLGRFEAICAANGVDTSKYKRTGTGWQGRLRMTGRNLLAKRIYLAGGVLMMPEGEDPSEYRAPAEWMQTQRYNMPKAEQKKPIPRARA